MGEFWRTRYRSYPSDPAGVKVVSPIDDTPAANANVRAGDVILQN